MGRRESPVPDGPLHGFAQDLRDLRAAAGAPTYRELARRARYSPSALSDAAAGRRLPTLDVTLALAAALGGDVDAWRARWEELDARLRATHPELVEDPVESQDGIPAAQALLGHTADLPPAMGAGPEADAAAEAAPRPEESQADPRPAIRQLVQAGEFERAAEATETWEQHAVRTYGTDSTEAAGWAEIRADIARAAGDMEEATRWWLTAAGRRLAVGPAYDSEAADAARGAHWCWERVDDPAEARALGEALTALLRQVPGLDPRHLPAVQERLDALADTGAADASDSAGPRTPAPHLPHTDLAAADGSRLHPNASEPGARLQPGSRPDLAAQPSATPSPIPRRDTSGQQPTGADFPVVEPLRKEDPKRIGGFRLLGRLGTGAMGQVFFGVSASGRLVAVKVIRGEFAQDATFRRRFAAEIATARRVQGPYTPAVVDADADAERPWLATTYISGPSLAEAVRADGPLAPAVVRALAAGIAEALVAIHGVGVLHRDLKPSNILLDGDGPKVIDFGVARAADHTQLTSAGVWLGTVPYMSPEQVEGRPLGPPCDVFSLGCLLAYAATGLTPFGEGSAGEVAARITNDAPDPAALAVGDDRLRDLITRCLDKDPGRRPTPKQIIAACADGQPHSDWLPAALAARIARRETGLSEVLAQAARKRTVVRLKVSTVPLILALALAVVLVLTTNRGGSTLDAPPPAPSVSGTGSAGPTSTSTGSPAASARASASASAGDASAGGPGYQTVFENRPVSLKDHDSFIDLMTGQVVTGSRYWMLGTDSGGDSKGAFELQDATDAYVAGSGPITPEQCAAGVAHQPAGPALHFAQVPLGSWFCLRWRLTGDIAVLKLSGTDTGSFGADVALTYYRHAPASATPGAIPGPADPHYRELYAARPLTQPDADTSFELTGGRLASAGAWLLSTDAGGDSKGAFEPQGTSDAYISGTAPLTPARCALGVAQQPVTKVHFPQVPAGTWFCVRSKDTGDIAVIEVLNTDDHDWTTTIAITAYKPATGGGS
ncbi:protein kinase domain-containing protein [Streptomyces roseochromogenus]|uniref:non-specific serine/threonine protein kinase n=1 Tax=Streptomyces roseochromogenus subsp. oscitans DS 12.976 TaxID=1352936 RepID=V6JFE8_STRRC|nr:protein kinase [Streptomyces roseochromogenus]EST18423.1 hypothetical protein M878_44715 [Streptomyces roseochromogenus subsp. oscitans DS 12.976]